MRGVFALLPLLFFLTPTLAGVKEIWWNLTYVDNANPDGLFERRVIGVNNTWPYVPTPNLFSDTNCMHQANPNGSEWDYRFLVGTRYQLSG